MKMRLSFMAILVILLTALLTRGWLLAQSQSQDYNSSPAEDLEIADGNQILKRQSEKVFSSVEPVSTGASGTSSAEAISLVNENKNLISLDIKGMDIVDVLKMLAGRAGINIVIGKNVTGRTTLFLKNVELWDAFEILLLANELAYVKKGDIVNVMTQRDYELIYGDRYQDTKQMKILQLRYAKATDLSRALNQIKTNIGRIVVDENSNTISLIDTPEKIKEMERFIAMTDLPIETRVFDLSYAQADKVQNKIQEILTKGVGFSKIDERTNKIVVTDYPAKLDEIAQIIHAFDEKPKQVLIDAQIIEINPSDTFEMGVDWDYWLERNFRITGSIPIGTSDRLILGTPSSTSTVSKKGDYKAILDLLRTIGETKVLSSPRIMVLNNQEAKILVGTKDAYITSTTSQSGESTITSQTVNFVDVGIKLYVTPSIAKDGYITMKIKPEVSSAERQEITSEGEITEIPIVTTSEAETTVMIKDGVTIIIGGLKKDERQKTVQKLPLLGDVPLLGLLFRSVSDEVETRELVILLTPHIVSGEKSYTVLSEIKPKDGAVARMEKGGIILEKISDISAGNNLGTIESDVGSFTEEGGLNFDSTTEADYYRSIVDKVRFFALSERPKPTEKGEVKLKFTISGNGNLIGEPSILETTNVSLNDLAIRSIKNASPFPAFPKGITKDKETFRIILSY
ncbi:MAG: TonB C-terminal domain-containing protein [Candidatus Omnitrophica bacterium]|nr:TonB C-terminal domain-containing protein [Candidatus Omnitrophota bacterium]